MRVIETSIDEDLSLFSQYLWQQRVRHRVFEESGRQVLELANAQDGDAVLAAYAAWSDGRLVLEAAPVADAGAARSSHIRRMVRAYPGLVVLIGAAVLLAGLGPERRAA